MVQSSWLHAGRPAHRGSFRRGERGTEEAPGPKGTKDPAGDGMLGCFWGVCRGPLLEIARPGAATIYASVDGHRRHLDATSGVEGPI